MANSDDSTDCKPQENAPSSLGKSDDSFTKERRRNSDTDLFSIIDPFLSLIFDASSSHQGLFDMNLPSVVRNGSVWEPPYAHLLRQLGLFDPIEIPRHAVNRYDSSFPVVVHSARVLQQPRSYKEGNEAIRDIRHIIDPISETFGQTTRWAVGSLFGQLRNAMDYVESSIQRPGEEQNRDNKRQQAEESIDPSALVRAIRSDLIVNFDRMFPESDKDIRSSYYQVSSRTMPDGSIETRKVVRDNGGTETTTVTKQYPDSSKNDERTVTSTEYDLSGPDTSDREK